MELDTTAHTPLTALATTLRKLIEEALDVERVERGSIEIRFERPSSDGFTRSTINLFLYELAENAQCREKYWNSSDSRGALHNQKRSMKLDASYRVSCWTQKPEDEHDLLWVVLRALYRASPLPREMFSDDLKRWQDKPIVTRVAPGGGTVSNLTEFWNAVGGPFHPSFSMTATLEMVIDPPELREKYERVRERDFRYFPNVIRLNGIVRDSVHAKRFPGDVPDAPAPGVKVQLLDVSNAKVGAAVVTDSKGKFGLTLGKLVGGTYYIHAEAPDHRQNRTAFEMPTLMNQSQFLKDDVILILPTTKSASGT